MPLSALDKIPFFLFFFAREMGLFLLSPLCLSLPFFLRCTFTFITSLLFLPHLFVQEWPVEVGWVLVVKEIGVGYLLGVLFSFLLEGALLSGRWFATLTGFSTGELLDPFHGEGAPLFSTFFLFTLLAILLALDFHHLFAYFLFDSFSLIPPFAAVPANNLLSLADYGQIIFSQGISFMLIPLFLLLALLLFMALLTKLYPEIPLFWIGLSIQLLFGLVTLCFLLFFITPLTERAFMKILEFIFLLY